MSPPNVDTEESQPARASATRAPIPGLLLVWSGQGPRAQPIPLTDELTLGRDEAERLGFDDPRMSRRHSSVRLVDGVWTIRDLDSRNGTFVDGERLTGRRSGPFRVLRAGRSVYLPIPDLNRHAWHVDASPDGVLGPRTREVFERIAGAARLGSTLLVTGTTGSGKELAARHFHRSGPGSAGPFVPVNCAAIPEGLAERVLFGTVRGAYSGAQADAHGYVQAADGGVLFLDELGELDLQIQGKLLRFLETREAYAIGATRPRPIDLRVCFATHRDLRDMVRERRFREDLYFRINQPTVRLPPLAERLEEVPWLIARAVAGLAPSVTPLAQFVEACLLRPWPGNVRELLGAVRAATQAAALTGSDVLDAEALDPDTGRMLDAPPPAPATISQSPPAASSESPPAREPVCQERLSDEAEIREALVASGGNVMQAARALGVHRNQLRRWLTERGFDPKSLAPEPER